MKDFIIGLLTMIGMFLVGWLTWFLIIQAGIWLTGDFLSWLVVLGLILILINGALFLLPLLNRAIPFVALTLHFSSYVYGIILWLISIKLSYEIFGLGLMIAGLLFLGFGVVPLAFLGTFISSSWPLLWILVLLVMLTFGTRIISYYMIFRYEESFNSSNERNSYLHDDFGELEENIEGYSDDQLMLLLTTDRNEYLSETIELAEEEAQRRKIAIDSVSTQDLGHQDDATEKKISGIRGWLILPLISLITYPFSALSIIYSDASMLNDPLYTELFIEISGSKTTLILEIFFNLGMIGFYLYAMILFFKKSSRFPKFYIVLLGTHALVAILYSGWLVTLYGSFEFKDILKYWIGAAIWIPYFQMSKRVKATFIH